VPIAGILDAVPHFRVLSTKNPHFKASMGIFKPNVQSIESFILPKRQNRIQPSFAKRWLIPIAHNKSQMAVGAI